MSAVRLDRAEREARSALARSDSFAQFSGVSDDPNDRQRRSAILIADDLLRLAKRVDGDRGARARGVAYAAAGDYARAAEAFAAVSAKTAADWNDLAAAQMGIAREESRAERWFDALVSADRAIELPAARFNRARILDAIGAIHVARQEWRRYVLARPPLPWGQVARRRAEVEHRAERDVWRAATQDFLRVPPDRLEALTRAYPETARRFAEAAYLPAWAEMVKRGDPNAPAQYEQVRVIAATLEKMHGERLLADTLRRIRVSAPLLDGLIAYRDGRYFASRNHPEAGERLLARAEALLRRSGCPLWRMARLYRVMVLEEMQRADDAVPLLADEELLEDAGHKALRAHVEYHLALFAAMDGHWSRALRLAQASVAGFAALHERENAATAALVVSENYDLIGQRELAFNHGVAALRDASAAGELERARIALAVLGRTALRAGMAERASALSRVEGELAALAPFARLDPDMYLRRATAQWRLGAAAGAAESLRLARRAANVFASAALRAKLNADVDAAEGIVLLHSQPRKAIVLLTSALEFHQGTARKLLLPQLFLQRGRAHLSANEVDAAAADFEAGIVELELQRSRVSEAELRPGLFDDASELFDEAIATQIRRGGDAESVFAYVERGRARAVMEEMQFDRGTAAPPVRRRIADVNRALSPAVAVIEYASLPDRLLVFVITPDRSVLRSLPFPRDDVRAAVSRLASARGAGGAELHEKLIAPLHNDLREVAAINFVGDALLQRVPFAALFDPRSQTFLVERYVIASSPSANVLVETLARNRALPDGPPRSALVFGNPAVPRAEFPGLPSLAESRAEALYVGRQYPRAEVVTAHEATSERFILAAPHHEVVHFGGHGVVNEHEPHASALVCAATPQRRGAVTAADIARIRFQRTRAVVLSACSTMSGRNAAVEGVPSLSRAFIVAGVPQVVGTLWDIQDGDAAAVTRRLHAALARGTHAASALGSAQRAAIRAGVPPEKWSAFAIMGSVAGEEDPESP